MTIKITRWTNDTCGCVIDYTWDDALPPESITTNLSNVIEKCPNHSSLPNNIDVWNSILDENPRKNISYQSLLDNGPSTIYDIVNGNRVLKVGLNYNFSFSGTVPNRILNISITGTTLTNAQKNTIQGALNTRFGTGKVVLT